MTHPTPPLSGENLLEDDDDIILLTDEIPPEQNNDLIEICQLTDRTTEPREVTNFCEPPKDEPTFIDLTDAIEPTDFKVGIPPDFSVTEDDILNLDVEDTRFSEPILSGPKPSAEDIVSIETPPQNLDTEYQQDSLYSETEEIFLQEISLPTLENELSGLQEILSAMAPSSAPAVTDVPRPSDKESPQDDLQRLINEVVHDSPAQPRDFSEIPPEINIPEQLQAVTSDMTALSPAQIDAAVQRAIQTLYEERIEPVLNEIISTAVSREIENLKTLFLDHLASGKTIRNSNN
jgi:hypothetical protein